jgi:parallel beta-helix repeat protein
VATSSDLTIVGNRCRANGYSGIQADTAISAAVDADQCARRITITGNVCDGNTNAGIYLANLVDSIISANVCSNNGTDGITGASWLKNINITGNYCHDTRSGGSRTQDSGIGITMQTDWVAQEAINISGNTCVNNLYDGIGYQQASGTCTVSGVTASGNTTMNNGRYGLFMVAATQSQCSNFLCVGNTSIGNTDKDMRMEVNDTVIGNNQFVNDYFDTSTMTLANSATPAVKGRSYFVTGGTTTITAFTGGRTTQTIYIKAAHTLTITHGASLVLNAAANFNMVSGNTLTLHQFAAGVWTEVSRKV